MSGGVARAAVLGAHGIKGVDVNPGGKTTSSEILESDDELCWWSAFHSLSLHTVNFLDVLKNVLY